MVHYKLVDTKAVLKQNKGARPRYYRFNVTISISGIELQKIDKIDKISQVTNTYLSEPERKELILDYIEPLYYNKAIRLAAG